LLTSESYDTLSESLGKFIEENGKISSSNIKELAESNKDLNALLEDNKFSASGLAEILTHIEDGTLSVLDLNDALIAAASAMDDLDGIV
jgi:F0F1-type ATP synthase delta subunit